VKKVTVACERLLEERQMTGSFLDKNKIQKHVLPWIRQGLLV
jgi:hypothetical protein